MFKKKETGSQNSDCLIHMAALINDNFTGFRYTVVSLRKKIILQVVQRLVDGVEPFYVKDITVFSAVDEGAHISFIWGVRNSDKAHLRHKFIIKNKSDIEEIRAELFRARMEKL